MVTAPHVRQDVPQEVPQADAAKLPSRVEILSADDWLALPDAHRRHELVAGHLTTVPAPDLHYDLIASDLARALGGVAHALEAGGMIASHTGFVVSTPSEEETVLVPALAFISAERLSGVSSTTSLPASTHASALLRVAPDLVLEIAAPSQRERELAERVLRWHSSGVRLVWVVWPARRQVAVWALHIAGLSTAETAAERHPRMLSAHDTLDGGEVLTGFAYTVAHLFL
jgi:Uma2 family endonuclease